MSIEAAVLIAKDGSVIYWHLPPDRRSAGCLTNAQVLWELIWENRANVAGIAHSHPGSGMPGPSAEDLATFSVVERLLGCRLIWWITSADQLVEVTWKGPGAHDYETGPEESPPEWLWQLRKHAYEHRMVRRWTGAPPQHELAESASKLGEPENDRE